MISLMTKSQVLWLILLDLRPSFIIGGSAYFHLVKIKMLFFFLIQVYELLALPS